MKTMGLDSLYLVRPKIFPHADCTARASGADDILAAARVCDSLPEALEDCRLVMGSSARRRTVEWPELSPSAAADRLIGESELGSVALVFGRESSGLSNQELDHCHFISHIPTVAHFSSLNLASAVQLYAYELRIKSMQEEVGAINERPVADAQAMERLHQHMSEALIEIGFAEPDRSTKLLRRLRRLFNRARPDEQEVNILRGILSAAQNLVRHR